MPGLPLAAAADLGFDPARLSRTHDLLREWTKADRLPAATLCVGRRGRMTELGFFGRAHPDAPAPLRSDALFLVASITKPVTVAAVLLLAERGLVALDDPVAAHLPMFGQNGKEGVLLRHLMTHTSGLPDMLPNNAALRAAHQPLAVFLEEIYRLPLLFAPGTRVSYQSTGTAVLSGIVRQTTGLALRDFLRREFFEPLGMADTSLGWQEVKRARIAAVRLPAGDRETNWNWNTPYWLGFGAPWGGMITSPSDFARYCQMMLNGGVLDGVRVLSPATVRAMTTNQLAGMAAVPEEERRCRPWGLGWRLNWPGHSANFGDLLGPRTYGHWGATGTLCWLDPETEVFCILFTTQPQEPDGRYLTRIANVVAAAYVG